MKLGNLLRTAGTAAPVNPKEVEFFATGRDQSLRPVKAKVKALLVYISEDERAQTKISARESIKRRYPDKVVPDGVLRDEETYQLLYLALREPEASADGTYPQLAENVDILRSSLVLREAQRLYEVYEQYVAEEFPPVIDENTWNELMEEAKKNSLNDLLTKYGYESAVAALSFLAGRSSR